MLPETEEILDAINHDNLGTIQMRMRSIATEKLGNPATFVAGCILTFLEIVVSVRNDDSPDGFETARTIACELIDHFARHCNIVKCS